MKLLINFINENFRTNITLPMLAQQISLNPTYVSTLFKESAGVNFKQYLIDTRINHAMKLLQNSNHTITFIADECGFNSVNNFCKAFKKIPAFRRGCFAILANHDLFIQKDNGYTVVDTDADPPAVAEKIAAISGVCKVRVIEA